MSITFSSDTIFETLTVKKEACLCAQGSEKWTMDLTGRDSEETLADLRAHANPECPFCQGSGVENREESDAPEVNWANGNAYRMLSVLGLSSEGFGEMSLADARRAVMRAKSRSDVSAFERAEERVYGRPKANEDGSIEMRPLRVYGQGLDADGIQERIAQFASFVEESARRGATRIWWG